ncbi:hypothetical protein ACET3Z_004465 [Daucus carota]
MEGKEGMALSGSSPYNLSRGVGGSVPNSGPLFGSSMQPGLASTPVFKSFTSPNEKDVENSAPISGHDSNMVVASDGANISLALSPMSSDPSLGSIVPGEKKGRGRPKGTGRKQRLASLGEWMTTSAGSAFTPHIIHIGAGEDIASKLLCFAQQRPRALCILSANGTVSSVTLRHPGSSLNSVTLEGRFPILRLSGSYLLSQGGPHNRTGGLSISIYSPEGHVLGGAVGGSLIAASTIQVVACTFVYDDWKTKNSPDAEAKADNDSDVQPTEKSSIPGSAGLKDPSEDIAPNSETSVLTLRCPGMTDPNTEIGLAHG